MTVATTARLAGPLQALIDARLDTIDRMLLGRVPRSDRLAIVREVEAQIHELLAGRDVEDIDREEVLAALGRLDPPEAYLPEEADEAGASAARSALLPRPARPSTSRRASLGRLGGGLGLAALGMVLLMPIIYLLAEALESEVLLIIGLFGAATLGFAGGLTGLILGIRAHGQGPWPVLGMVTGTVAGLLSLIGGMALMILLAG